MKIDVNIGKLERTTWCAGDHELAFVVSFPKISVYKLHAAIHDWADKAMTFAMYEEFQTGMFFFNAGGGRWEQIVEGKPRLFVKWTWKPVKP